jgi:lipoprotein-anchoring transpeptidase ErfK/SrfK
VSHGCIRMHNADILDLFGRVSTGTQVVIAH